MTLSALSLPRLPWEPTPRTLLAAGSVVLAGVAIGSLVKYRGRLIETLRRPATPAHALDSLTKDELYERARAEAVEGRSTMSKAELIDALRDA